MAMTRTRSRPAMRRPRSKYGRPDFCPTLAGQANAQGDVFDRLSSPQNFTGVYRRAYYTDGRMNAFADTGVSAIPSAYEGDTNTLTNETIHDIRSFLRPHLRVGNTFR